MIEVSVRRGLTDSVFEIFIFLLQEREIQYGSVQAPEVSERGFPVALHRGNFNEQVNI